MNQFSEKKINNLNLLQYIWIIVLLVLEAVLLGSWITKWLVEITGYQDKYSLGWVLHYFTTQSNLILLAFSICYLIDLKKPFIKTHFFRICACTYICVTFLIYWGLLFRQDLSDGKFNANAQDKTYIFTCILSHALCPLLFIGLTILTIFTNDKKQFISFKNTALYGLIYPFCYTAYCVILNLASKGNYTVYGDFTNVWKVPLNSLIIILVNGIFIGLICVWWKLLEMKNKPGSVKKEEGLNLPSNIT